MKRLGADEVIDYTAQDVTGKLQSTRSAGHEYDLIVDCVGGTEIMPYYSQLLHRGGAYITIVGDKTDIKTLGGPITYMFAPAQIFRFIKGYLFGPRYACV